MAVRIDHAITSGTFSLDGQTFDVDNNVWVFGDEAECVVVDAPHDVDAIADLVGDRRLTAILAVLTRPLRPAGGRGAGPTPNRAHDDHIRAAPRLAEVTGAPVLLHPDDLPLWRLTHPDRDPDGALRDSQVIEVAGMGLTVLHTSSGRSREAVPPAHPRPRVRSCPGPRARRVLLLRAVTRRALQRGHPVPGWPGRHRAVLL